MNFKILLVLFIILAPLLIWITTYGIHPVGILLLGMIIIITAIFLVLEKKRVPSSGENSNKRILYIAPLYTSIGILIIFLLSEAFLLMFPIKGEYGGLAPVMLALFFPVILTVGGGVSFLGAIIYYYFIKK